jgi:hypothetical protein
MNRYQVGTYDLRGMALYNNRIFVSSAYLTEPNLDGATNPFRPHGGILEVGDNTDGTLERNATNKGELLPGFDGRKNYWGFHFQDARRLWVIEDATTYATDPSSQPPNRVKFRRTELNSVVTAFWYSYDVTPNAWVQNRVKRTLVAKTALYSLAGRFEGTSYVLYSASRFRIWRIENTGWADTPKLTTVAEAAPRQMFRSVSLPPLRAPTPTRSPAATPSRSAAR